MQISEQYTNHMGFAGCQMPRCRMWDIPQVGHYLVQTVCNLGRNWRIPINISAYGGYRDTCLSGHIADCYGGGTPSHSLM
jgi:hypothetical protein